MASTSADEVPRSMFITCDWCGYKIRGGRMMTECGGIMHVSCWPRWVREQDTRRAD